MRDTSTLRLQFSNPQGNNLDARLELPDGDPLAYAVFSHCCTCTKDTLATYRVSRQLAQHGIAVLRFDFTGLGGSEGDFAKTNFSSNVTDALAAIRFLENNYKAPSLLIGHSLGGTAMLEAATKARSVKAVATIASPSQPMHVLHHFGTALTMLEQGIASSIEVAGEHYEIEPQFIEDMKKHDMQQSLASLQKPVLIFKIINDALVDAYNADEIDAWTAGESRIITLEKADHILSDKTDAAYVAEEIAEWFKNI